MQKQNKDIFQEDHVGSQRRPTSVSTFPQGYLSHVVKFGQRKHWMQNASRLNSLKGSNDFACACVCIDFRFHLGHPYCLPLVLMKISLTEQRHGETDAAVDLIIIEKRDDFKCKVFPNKRET